MLSFREVPNATIKTKLALCVATDQLYELPEDVEASDLLRRLIINMVEINNTLPASAPLRYVNDFIESYFTKNNDRSYILLLKYTTIDIFKFENGEMSKHEIVKVIIKHLNNFDTKAGLYKKLKRYIIDYYECDKNPDAIDFKDKEVIDILVFTMYIKLLLPIIHLFVNTCVQKEVSNDQLIAMVYDIHIGFISFHSPKAYNALLKYVIKQVGDEEDTTTIFNILCKLVVVDLPPILMDMFAGTVRSSLNKIIQNTIKNIKSLK